MITTSVTMATAVEKNTIHSQIEAAPLASVDTLVFKVINGAFCIEIVVFIHHKFDLELLNIAGWFKFIFRFVVSFAR